MERHSEGAGAAPGAAETSGERVRESLQPSGVRGRWRGRARPYRIRVSGRVLRDVKSRLARTRWPDELENAGWQYGSSLGYMQQLIEYWRTGFDWLAQERWLNSFAQFRMEIDGLRIHFVHERGKGPAPMPLILTHGWPGSFWQYLKLLPLLTDPERHGADPGDAFDVVIPSVPGFGFSDRPRQLGVFSRLAPMWAELMRRLGYERYAAHGGDMGSAVTESLARAYPENVIGIHLTDVPYYHIFAVPPDQLTDAERAYIAAGRKWQEEEGAYALLQGTTPQTITYALNDSPAGLAAWIIDKFYRWSDSDGDLEKRFTKDDLLTNVMIYWASSTIGSSIRYYYELTHGSPPASSQPVTVPAGVALFPKDLVLAPRELAERVFSVQRWTQMPRGGHFPAWEEPELLAQDLREFFRPLRAGRTAH